MNFNVDLGATLLVDASGRTVSVSSALANKAGVALYFSAHWCPPCRQFTPILAETYKKSYKEKRLEIIFVSSDRDDASFRDYFATMPWLALPFSERRLKDQLASKLAISGIPALIVFDAQGRLVESDGRSAVMKNPSSFFGLTAVASQQSQIPKSPEVQKPPVSVNPQIPTTKLQFRFPDGRKTVQEFNETATVRDLKNFVAQCSGGVANAKLAAGFPPKDLSDDLADIKTLNLFDSVVTIK